MSGRVAADGPAGDATGADLLVVRHPRARRAKLSVDPRSGTVRLTLPPRAALAPAMRWAADQAGWIAAQRARLPRAQPFVPGAVVPVDDALLTIRWQESHPRRVERVGAALHCGGPIEAINARVTAWLKRLALARLSEETAEFAGIAGVTVARVAIGDPAGRWGSCSAAGVVRYSWRLILAPAHVRRATVAHEVAHRVHMHHGPDFHALVASILGADPAPARAWLRGHGAALHWFGRAS